MGPFEGLDGISLFLGQQDPLALFLVLKPPSMHYGLLQSFPHPQK